jgi:hypothetical protein
MSNLGKGKAATKAAKTAKTKITLASQRFRVVSPPTTEQVKLVKERFSLKVKERFSLKDDTFRDVVFFPTTKDIDKSMASGTVLKLKDFKKGVKL